jgi:hypothetical protein
MIRPIRALRDAWGKTQQKIALNPAVLVHRAPRGGVRSPAIAPGVRALSVEEFVAGLRAERSMP